MENSIDIHKHIKLNVVKVNAIIIKTGDPIQLTTVNNYNVTGTRKLF